MRWVPPSDSRSLWIIAGASGILAVAHIAEIVALVVTEIAIPDGFLPSYVVSALITTGLLYGVYRIYASGLPPTRIKRIVGWFVAGALAFLLLNIGFMLTTAMATGFRLVTWIVWAITLGGGMGFAMGVFEARAIHREVEAERGRIREAELQQERDRLERFANTISHDLRNPLTIAMTRLELAQEESDSEHVDMALTSLDRIEVLIEDILSLARNGKEIDDRQSIAVDGLAESCWEGVQTNGAKLEIDVDGTIQADRSRLRQVFENLIRNAVEHGGEGVAITVGKLEDGFYVEDDGSGIPADEREDVFELGHTTSETGTGFGLAIVNEIVQAHGWDIDVTEGMAGGSRFEITDVQFGPVAEAAEPSPV
jgi:signal transduction histidine kinase